MIVGHTFVLHNKQLCLSGRIEIKAKFEAVFNKPPEQQEKQKSSD